MYVHVYNINSDQQSLKPILNNCVAYERVTLETIMVRKENRR